VQREVDSIRTSTKLLAALDAGGTAAPEAAAAAAGHTHSRLARQEGDAGAKAAQLRAAAELQQEHSAALANHPGWLAAVQTSVARHSGTLRGTAPGFGKAGTGPPWRGGRSCAVASGGGGGQVDVRVPKEGRVGGGWGATASRQPCVTMIHTTMSEPRVPSFRREAGPRTLGAVAAGVCKGRLRLIGLIVWTTDTRATVLSQSDHLKVD
jgi:hypothetical protein